MTDLAPHLTVTFRSGPGDVRTVVPHGILDSRSYLHLRDAIVKAATDEPAAVLVDIDDVEAPAPTAWSVLTSARWLISTWPDIPVAVVSSIPRKRETISRNGITRYVPCCADVATALRQAGDRSTRKRAVVELGVDPESSAAARAFVRNTIEAWRIEEYDGIAVLVATILVEHSLRARLAPKLRVELRGGALSLSVSDPGARLPVRSETPIGTPQFTAWGMLTTLCRSWGAMPDFTGGRAVWAMIGPENLI